MKTRLFFLPLLGLLVLGASSPHAREAAGVAYTDFANIFTSNQRINAGLGINVAPGATGTISSSSSHFERSRSVAMGEWTTPTFAAGDFTANGSMTWTVASGDVTTYAYTLIGKTMIIAYAINGTTVGGTLNNTLFINLPGSNTAAKEFWSTTVLTDNGVRVAARQFIASGATKISVQRLDTANYSASTGATSILGVLTLEIQ